MATQDSFFDIRNQIDNLDKQQIKTQLLNFEGRFHLDFTEDYLEHLPVDRLKHILASAVMVNSLPKVG